VRWRSHSADRAAQQSSLDTIATLRRRFEFLKNSFIIPEHLEFREDAADLTFTSANAAVHTYTNELNKLLTLADGVSSAGSERVRNVRRTFVKLVEKTLDEVEGLVADIWRKRQGGETTSVKIEITGGKESGPAAEEKVEAEAQDQAIFVDAQASIEAPSELTTSDAPSVPRGRSSTASTSPESTPASDTEYADVLGRFNIQDTTPATQESAADVSGEVSGDDGVTPGSDVGTEEPQSHSDSVDFEEPVVTSESVVHVSQDQPTPSFPPTTQEDDEEESEADYALSQTIVPSPKQPVQSLPAPESESSAAVESARTTEPSSLFQRNSLNVDSFDIVYPDSPADEKVSEDGKSSFRPASPASEFELL